MAWVEACRTDAIEAEDVKRFDYGTRTFAIYRSPDGDFYVTDGLCTHESVHLADGLVIDTIIECPKHTMAGSTTPPVRPRARRSASISRPTPCGWRTTLCSSTSAEPIAASRRACQFAPARLRSGRARMQPAGPAAGEESP
jgi:MocE subfamily Rieske [2Fe-2S] domain protein